MKIYILDADVGKYRPIYYTDENDVVDLIRRFNGKPMRNIWKAEEKFAFVPRRMIKGDTPGLNTHIPVFSVRAAKALEDFLNPNGELLPINCDGEKYFVYNVTNVIDALDENNCELKLFDSGHIMDITHFAFFQRRLKGATVFKVPQCVLTDVFVIESFVEAVKAANLKGFKFRLVWSSD